MTTTKFYAARSKARGPAYADRSVAAARGNGTGSSTRFAARWRARRWTLRCDGARFTAVAWIGFGFADLANGLRLAGTFSRACSASCAAKARVRGAVRGAASSAAHAAQTGSSNAVVTGTARRSGCGSGCMPGAALPNRPRNHCKNRWRVFMVRTSLSPLSYSCPNLA
jgi:hypothetical protein